MFKTILNLMFRPRTPNAMPIAPLYPSDYTTPSCNCRTSTPPAYSREINHATTEIVPNDAKGDWVKEFMCMYTCQNYDSYEYNLKEDICACKGTSMMWRGK